MPGNLRIRKVKLYCNNISTSRAGAKKGTNHFSKEKIFCRTTKVNRESRKCLDCSKCHKTNLCCINPKNVSRITEFVCLCLTTFGLSVYEQHTGHQYYIPTISEKQENIVDSQKLILERDSSAGRIPGSLLLKFLLELFNKIYSTLIPSFYTGHKSICYDWL